MRKRFKIDSSMGGNLKIDGHHMSIPFYESSNSSPCFNKENVSRELEKMVNYAYQLGVEESRNDIANRLFGEEM